MRTHSVNKEIDAPVQREGRTLSDRRAGRTSTPRRTHADTERGGRTRQTPRKTGEDNEEKDAHNKLRRVHVLLQIEGRLCHDKTDRKTNTTKDARHTTTKTEKEKGTHRQRLRKKRAHNDKD